MIPPRFTQHPSNRAGRYERQPSGARAFIPAPLPPSPPIRMEGMLPALLSDADRALGRLDGSIQTLPNPDLFVAMYIKKEAVLSSQIEGTQSSLQELLSAEAALLGNTSGQDDVDEVIRYVRAMNHGLERLAALPVSVRLIREIHVELMRGGRGGTLEPGELRRSQNWIGPSGCTIDEAVFVPPPPQLVESALSELELFIHRSEHIPALIRIGLVHAQFETIHPFLDGNGRIGRLLITFLLMEAGILQKPVLYLSYHFKRYRATYYDRLQAVRDEGDWERWLEFFLSGVAEVSLEATDTTRRILALREEHRSRITDSIGRSAGNGHRVLERLFHQPIVSVNNVMELTGCGYSAANNLIEKLERLGIVLEVTGNARNRRFRYEPYLRLFESDPSAARR